MWMFERNDFRRWLEMRQEHDEVGDLPEALRHRCLSCGTDLDSVPYTDRATCGFCLAYQFGYESHEDRLAAAVTGVAKIVCDDDPDSFKFLYRQLQHEVLEYWDAVRVPPDGESAESRLGGSEIER